MILASENLLEQWGTRTERGEKITAEWGEPGPEGWYEPTFTVHSDDTLAAAPHSGEGLDVETLARALNERSTYEFVPWPFHAVCTEKVYDPAKLAAAYARLRENTDAE